MNPNSELKTQNIELRTQNSEHRTQNIEVRTSKSEHRSQNIELRTLQLPGLESAGDSFDESICVV